MVEQIQSQMSGVALGRRDNALDPVAAAVMHSELS